MRKFPMITVGKVLQELKQDGYPITRLTFYRMEKRFQIDRRDFPEVKRNMYGWRIFSKQEADYIKEMIKDEYRPRKRRHISL